MTKFPAEFCPMCGSSLGSKRFEGRERQHCADCDRIVFRQPGSAANVAVVDGQDVLLVQRKLPPHEGSWALPGGAVEYDEPLAAAAVRELREETDIEVSPDDLVPFDTWQHEWPEDDVYVGAVGYAVSRADTTGEPDAGSDAKKARFRRLEKQTVRELRPGGEDRMRRAIVEMNQ
ncbi:NUDIX hydrolase [Halococcus agarilyticus]|uniref:NUDIX hydrolase n=1 Tax=Halococcus agarilyticus TaxID=1232219 RepID=UPI000677CDDB|nr:NUDIX hydrolase [Halococcus agarilyticus]